MIRGTCIALALAVIAGPAFAQLKVCNESETQQDVSIGYNEDGRPVSEGWWKLEPGECATPIGVELTERFYFLRPEHRAGPFKGDGHYFCTQPTAYTILGDHDCQDRGFDREDFMLVDIGRGVSTFTYTLTAEVVDARQETAGLKFCNETSEIQSVSIGYRGAEDWVSEGWWNVEPGECKTPIGEPLTQQHYFWRAEVNGGDFDGGRYDFCTTPTAYTIVGEKNCHGRGYDSELFARIDTQGAPSHTVTIRD